MKRLLLALTATTLLLLAPASSRAGEPEKYNLESISMSLADSQAGAHSDFTTDLVIGSDSGVAYANTKDVIVRLPPGLFGNPEAFPKCTTLQLNTLPLSSECPFDSQIGSTDIVISGSSGGEYLDEPVYNMPAPGGDVVARFGFYAGLWPVFVDARLDPDTQTIVATVENAPSAAQLVESSTTFWAVPADPVHDGERLTPYEVASHDAAPPGGRKSTAPETPFMTNPTSCGAEQQVSVTVTSYQLPGQSFTKTAPFPQITGCGLVDFSPAVVLV